MSTHNLCFGAKIRKNIYTPAYPSFAIYKMGYKGVYIARTCYPDVVNGLRCVVFSPQQYKLIKKNKIIK